nr:hypothetical protein [Tanacetum cinerariifolium]
MQTQTSNALHNAIMEASGKDRPRMLAPTIERLKQGESINVQDLETNLYWEFGKFTSQDGESLESYYSRFYKMMNELVRNQRDVTNHQVNVQDDTDDEPDDQELEARYMYMAQIQEVTQDVVDNSRPIFDSKPLQKKMSHNVIMDSLDMRYDREHVDQDDDDLANEHDLLASLIEKLKYEIEDSKNRNKFLETSNKALVDKLKGEIEDFKTKNKSLESSNNHFKEANNELSKTNQLMFKDLKKFQAELDRHHDVKYASKVEIDCAKAKGDLMSYKMVSEKSFNEYTRKINDLNQTISEMKKELFAHQETISIITSFAKPEFLKKAQRANPHMYDIGCYNDNLDLMLAPESDKVVRLKKKVDQN